MVGIAMVDAQRIARALATMGRCHRNGDRQTTVDQPSVRTVAPGATVVWTNGIAPRSHILDAAHSDQCPALGLPPQSRRSMTPPGRPHRFRPPRPRRRRSRPGLGAATCAGPGGWPRPRMRSSALTPCRESPGTKGAMAFECPEDRPRRRCLMTPVASQTDAARRAPQQDGHRKPSRNSGQRRDTNHASNSVRVRG